MQVERRWIADSAVDHTKLDSSDSYTLFGLYNTGSLTVDGTSLFNSDATVHGNIKIDGTAFFNINALATPATTFLTHTAGLIQSRTASQVSADLKRTITITSSYPYTVLATDDVIICQ